jgi:hypothetical protein
MNESNDHEWLLARERGEDVSHIPAYTREKYCRLDRLIRDLPTCAPSPGWKQRVLDSLDDPLATGRPRIFPLATARSRVASPQRSPPRPPRPRHERWALGSGIMSLAAVLAVCVYVQEPTVHERPEVVLSSDHAHVLASGDRHDGGGQRGPFDDPTVEPLEGAAEATPTAPFPTALVGVRRAGKHRGAGNVLHIGDTLVIQTVADRPLELRVYGDTGEPLARCTEAHGCRVEQLGARRRYRLELKLDAPGAVLTVAYAGATMPAAFVSLDNDTEVAGRAGIIAREISVVHVE